MNMKDKYTIRIATPDDARHLLNIYEYYVKNTSISFEYEVPTLEEFRSRIVNTLKKYPYIVADCDGAIEGYAYAGAFKGRKAYDWAVETSIYVRHGFTKSGIGKLLYEELEKALSYQNITNVNACIAVPHDRDDEKYCTNNSMDFHEHMGYRFVGRFTQCGYKFGRWFDMVWMEKLIGEHVSGQLQVKTFDEIKDLLK
jgi:L-amino acid N-acyltransferase YncA